MNPFSTLILCVVAALVGRGNTVWAGVPHEKNCEDVPSFVNFGELPNGSRTRRRAKVNFMTTWQGGAHFGARKKGQRYEVFDDGILIAHGKTRKQLVASSNINRRSSKPAWQGSEIMAVFDIPVTAHSLLVIDTNGPKGRKDYADFGRIYLYGRKNEVIKTIELPPNTEVGARLSPPGNVILTGVVGSEINLGDTPGVTKMLIDFARGAYNSIDRVKITQPCDGIDREGLRNGIVIPGPFERIPQGTKHFLKYKIKGTRGKRMQWEECVGMKVEECKSIIKRGCPECGDRIKAATPRKFDFYRIWIKCDENGVVTQTPRRG